MHQEGQATGHKQNCLMQQSHNCCFGEGDEHRGEQQSEPMDKELSGTVSAESCHVGQFISGKRFIKVCNEKYQYQILKK